MGEEVSVLDQAVEALNKVVDKLDELTNVLYAVGYVMSEMNKGIVSLDQTVKALTNKPEAATEEQAPKYKIPTFTVKPPKKEVTE